MDAGKRLGVPPPPLTARDLADPEVDYIAPMSYVARYMWLPRKEVSQNQLRASCTTKAIRVGDQVCVWGGGGRRGVEVGETVCRALVDYLDCQEGRHMKRLVE